jgi:hypothetical protein
MKSAHASGAIRRWSVGGHCIEIPDYANPERTYLRRWYLIETPFLGVKLHHIKLSDNPERGYHDHPWSFLSIKLRGGYRERLLLDRGHREVLTGRHRVTYRRAEAMHLVVLDDEEQGCWTLVFSGPRRRKWGFRKPLGGWVPWDESPGPSIRQGRTAT